MAENFTIRQTVDLSGINPNWNAVRHDALMYPGDNLAHTWEVQVKRNGIPVDMIGGNVVGYFQRKDGNTVMVNGTIEDSICKVTMAQECYAISGAMKAVMRYTEASTHTVITLAYHAFTVQGRIDDGGIIDPGEVIPSIDDLLAEIEAMEEATAAAEAAATKSVRYDSAQTLTDAQKEQARGNVGAASEDDVTDLKSQMAQFTIKSKNILPIPKKETTVNGVDVTYEDGQITFSGTVTTNGGRTTKLTDIFALSAGTYTFWSVPNTGLGSLYIQNASSNAIISACNNNTTGTFTLESDTEVYIGQNFTSGTTYNNVWNIQAEKGTVKSTFEKPSKVSAIDEEARTLAETNADRIDAIEEMLPQSDSEKLTFILNGNDFSIITHFNGADLTLAGFVTQSDKDNPAFDFSSYSGAFSKVAEDDIAPVYYNGSYRCGGHGNNVVMNLTSSNHGLTESDIGRSFTLNDVTWILVKIVDASHVWVISDITNVPTRPFVATIAESGTLVGTGKNIVYTGRTVAQLLPNNIRRTYAIYGNGDAITENGTYELSELQLVESYQSLDCIAMVEYLKAHVGNNTNTTYCSDDRAGELMYECTYTFHGDSDCVITQTLTALRDNIDMSFAGFTQAQAYSNVAYVPFTSYATPTEISSTTLTLGNDTWDSADFPPYKYYELNGTAHLGFVCGYDITFGMGKPEVRKIGTGNNAGNFNGTSKKIYPKFWGDGQVIAKGTKISGTAFRMPVVYKNNLITYTWRKDNERFIEVEIFDAGTYTISIGTSNLGNNIEVVKASDSLHLSDMVLAYPNINIIATGAGSATLKIVE